MNKQYRLKKSFEIEKLVKKRISVGSSFFVIYYNISSDKKSRIAFSVSKKLGNAVKRNHEKRVLREILRDVIDTIDGLDILIVEKNKALALSYDEKRIELFKLIKKIIRKGN
jgi:ribonuclease P protein component